jgi:hypothetical protein
MKKTMDAYGKVTSYTCLFDKKERIGSDVHVENNILLKYMKPSSVYMKWTEGPNEGVEAIYVKGKYDDKLKVHLGGLMSFVDVSVDPDGDRAMKNNRHPITEAGIGFVLELINENYEKARSDGKSTIKIAGRESSEDGDHIIVEASLQPDNGYYAHIVKLIIDSGSYLPVGITAIGWDGNLMEEYRFRDVRINPGLSEIDFDVDNPNYGF